MDYEIISDETITVERISLVGPTAAVERDPSEGARSGSTGPTRDVLLLLRGCQSARISDTLHRETSEHN